MAFSTNVNDYSSQLDSLLGGYTGARTSFYGGQRNDINDFLGRYKTAIAGQTPYSALQERAENEYGVPQLQKTATTVQNAFNAIPGTYTSGAKGYDVNANQLSKIIGTKTSEMAPAVQASNTALSNATTAAGARTAQGIAQQEKELRPYASEQSMLGDALARESTGFTTEMEAKLNGYLDKMKQGIALSTTEYQEAQAYARAKLSYDASKYTADKKYEGDRLMALSTLGKSF